MVKKVKVKIKDGYTGHHHEGKECFPGEEVEVWEDKVPFLIKVGAIDPPTKKSKKKAEAEAEPEEPLNPEPTGDE
jgi:hypothetical protein